MQEQQVMRFCETLPLMEASKEPVVVPVRALCFTCNINEKMNFRHRRGKPLFDLQILNELMKTPATVGELRPIDTFLDVGPDGKRVLYCRNSQRLLVQNCLETSQYQKALIV